MNQIANGKYMRTAWATFAKDPKQGLTNFGWPEYSTKGNTLIQLAFNDTLGPNLNQGDAYDDTCRGIPKVTSDDTAAIGGGNMSAGGATVSSHGNDTEADPPIPLDWYKDCVTGFWLGYFCIL